MGQENKEENKEENKGQKKKEEDKKEEKEEEPPEIVLKENKEENKGQEKKDEDKKEVKKEEEPPEIVLKENKDESKGEEQKEQRKEEKKDEEPLEIVLKVDMHREGVATDMGASRMVVKGNAPDPIKMRDMLQEKTKRRFELISPLPKPPEEKEENKEQREEKNEEENKEENKGPEKKVEEKKEEEEEPTDIVFKANLHCEGCAKKIARIIRRVEGVEGVTTDMETGKVVVKVNADPIGAGEGLQKRRGRKVVPISPLPEPPDEKKEERKEQKEAKKEEVPLRKWIFVVFNLTLELPSAVFDQLSLSHKPLYALVAMTLSLLAFALCVIELLYDGLKKEVTFKRPEDKILWFYYPPRSRNPKRFGTFADFVGLVSAISQCIVTAINYDFARRAADSPIKFPLLPIIFAFGLLCSIIVETVEKRIQTDKIVEDRF